MAEKLNFINTANQTVPGNRLSYPAELFSNYTDYIKFDFYNYKGPFSGDGGGGTTDINGGSITPQLQTYNQTNGQQYTKYAGVEPILMYMPEDISTGYRTDWTGKGFSNMAANSLRTGGNALAGDGGAAVTAFVSAITTATSAVPSAAAQALSTGINALGNDNVTMDDVLQGSLGVVLNPNTELMFQGFKLRSFGLKFKMSPRNANEARVIRKIIGTFKKVALPSFGPNPGGPTDLKGVLDALSGSTKNSNTNYIGVPGLCTVQFMKGAALHPFLPQYKVCAITDVSINYTPDGTYSTLDQFLSPLGDQVLEAGAPVAVELNLEFSETKLVYSQEIQREGASY